jgi:hypothetical protein
VRRDCTRHLKPVPQEFDADGSGFITVDEFLNTMHKRWLRQNEAEIDLAEGADQSPRLPKHLSTPHAYQSICLS